ncbi:MAG: hypothetical protein CSA05_02450 [Bacteroidia bacterium]|nr:MAG: hypothetical protein CSA05_02450 [Bacteroidia bacterium]
MRTKFLSVVLIFLFVTSFAQENWKLSPGMTFYDSNGTPFTVLRKVTIRNYPMKVPEGKIWQTVENKYTKAVFSSSIRSKTHHPCKSCFQQTPKVMFAINEKKPYEDKIEKWGLIYSKANQLPERNAFEFVPDAFISSEFDQALLKVMVPRMVGKFDVKFYPGTELYLDSCLQSLELVEVDMPYYEASQYKQNLESKRIAYERRIAELNRLRQKRRDEALLKKIKSGEVFTLEELDKEPEYQLHVANFLEFYKKVYYNKFYVDFVVNEDGSIKFIKNPKISIRPELLENFIKFTPGKIVVAGQERNITTKLRLIFDAEKLQKYNASTAAFEVKKRRKEPYIKIKRFPDQYPEKKLKKIIKFRKALHKKPDGNYEFNLEKYRISLNIVLKDESKEKQLISQRVLKYRYKFRERNGGWNLQ